MICKARRVANNRFIIKFVLILAVFLALICKNTFAYGDVKLQIYFSPQIMNDITGEITVDVNMRNYSLAVPKNLGSICGITFSCEFDSEHFKVKEADNSAPEVITDKDTLVKLSSDIETKLSGNRLTVTFMDSSLTNNLIDSDGTLFRFTLVSKNVSELWNSTDYYPLRFVHNSIGVVTYNLDSYSVGSLYSAEGLDGKVGAYNVPPTLTSKPVGKKLTFTADSTELDVDGEVVSMDAPARLIDGRMMVPVRFFAENIGMAVEWDGGTMLASAYADYKTLKISLQDNAVYINSARYSPEIEPIEQNGRIYVSADTINALWRNAETSEDDGSLTVCIP